MLKGTAFLLQTEAENPPLFLEVTEKVREILR
jgi:hypothetical protein